jgi:hypothetical protein
MQRGQSTLEWVIGAAVILGTLTSHGTIPQTREIELEDPPSGYSRGVGWHSLQACQVLGHQYLGGTQQSR